MRIGISDDNELDIEIFREVLELYNLERYEFKGFRCHEDLIEELKVNSSYDLIVLDYYIPNKMSAYQAINVIRLELGLDMRIVVITGYPEYRDQFVLMDNVDFIVKPVDYQKLIFSNKNFICRSCNYFKDHVGA